YTYDQALDTLNLILEMKEPSFRLIEQGRFLRLVELREVPKTGRIVKGLADIGMARPGEVVTVVIPLKHLDAGEVSKAIVPMVSKFGSITPMSRGKGIIVTDSVANIQRMRRLLSQMESEPVAEEQFKSVRLKHASANNVAQIVTRLFGTTRRPTTTTAAKRKARTRTKTPPPVIPGRLIATADQRTNTVFLLGPPDKIAIAEQLIEKLDVPKGITGGEMRVFKLKNARAEDLTKTVQSMIAPRRTARDRETAQFRVAAEPVTNRVIISGPVDQMDEAEKLIRELDEGASIASGAEIVP
ncbi:unnamed protein product, partial [marine sediment metagenome]